jgi:hypothetical protein
MHRSGAWAPWSFFLKKNKKQYFYVSKEYEKNLDVVSKYLIVWHTLKWQVVTNFESLKMCTFQYTRSIVLSFLYSPKYMSFELKFYTLVGYISSYMLILFGIFWNLNHGFQIFQKKSSMELELQNSTPAFGTCFAKSNL